ncbi:MAG: flagellar assembly protein FliH [Desulfovibrio sp.]|nr:flagellar assembly protein FliH [Desulfovibrio sp.]
MSDSKKDDGKWGTLFSQGRERLLSGLERNRAASWTAADESAYLDRVKEKAEHLAASIIAEARAEATRLQEAAKQEGFQAGMDNAQAELDNFRNTMAESVSSVLGAIEGQCSHIFDQWRDDIVNVSRLAVEKITAIQLTAERRAVLESLLVEAVSLLEKRREILIRVNAEDEPVIADILAITQSRYPDVKSWRVRSDDNVSAGGMVVESESSLAEGRLESRRAAVEEVLGRLSLAECIPAPVSQDAGVPAGGNDHES